MTEDFTADSSRYVAALEAMARAAKAAADEQARLVAGIEAMQRAMDAAAAGAAEAAAAEDKLAEAEQNVAKGGAAAAAAENAAAGVTGNLGKAAATAAGSMAALTAAESRAITVQAGMDRTSRMLADSLEAVALAEEYVDRAAGQANEAMAAGSLAAHQNAEAARGFAEADAALAQAQNVAAEAATRQGMAESYLASAMTDAERDALGLTGSMAALTAASDAAGGGATRAAFGFRAFGFGLAFTRNALHWVVAGAAEFLAVAIPATYALAAGLMVAAQGAQNVQQHFSALYAATESTYAAFGKTVGSVLGLHSALQQAQNAANPGVYELLGSVIKDAKASFSGFASVGLQVVHMFDQFAARVTVDLQGSMGAQLHGLLSGAVSDLQQFGQVLGNIGHALLNFASAMPGLAHFLLDIAQGLSAVIRWASQGGILITFAMGLEEMYRWGGLALTGLVRLTGQMSAMNALGSGGFIFRFGAALETLVSAGGRALLWVGQFIGRAAGLSSAFGSIGGAVASAGGKMANFVEAIGPMALAGIAGGVALVAGAMALIAYQAMSAKTATEQWIATSQQMVAQASDLSVLPTIYSQLAATTVHLASAQGALSHVQLGNRIAMGEASLATTDLASHMMSMVVTAGTVRSNIGLLAGVFHTSQAGALALANAAGVNLQVGLTKGGEAAKIAEQQIINLKTGLGAMTAPIGVIGADMQAVGIQSQLASSKVGQVNQSLDAFIAGTTGGMDQIMQFNAALHTMGNDAVSSSVGIDGAIRSISRSAASMGYTLQGFGPKAQQSWQQFDAALQQGNSVLDTFRTGMAEGMVSAGQYQNEIRAVGGSLLPFAAHNRTALAMVSQLAQEMGAPASHNLKTLAGDFGITGKAAQNMATIGMERAIARMSNLSAVARNLSATISGQLDSAMAGAIVKASGLDTAYRKWATDAMNIHTPASTLKSDLADINRRAAEVNTTMGKAARVLNNNATGAKSYGSALKGASGAQNDFGAAVKQSHASLVTQEVSAKTAALSTQGFGSQARTAGTSATGLATNASAANTVMKALGTSAATTRGNLGTVNNEIRTTGTAASGSTGPLSSMIGNISRVGSQAATAAGQVYSLASAISSLQSKTITITTNMVTNAVHRQGGGPVLPGIPAIVGEAGREMFVPAVPGYVVPHEQTERMLASGGGGGGPQVLEVHAELHSHLNMDGQQVMTVMQPHILRYDLRNGRDWSSAGR